MHLTEFVIRNCVFEIQLTENYYLHSDLTSFIELITNVAPFIFTRRDVRDGFAT